MYILYVCINKRWNITEKVVIQNSHLIRKNQNEEPRIAPPKSKSGLKHLIV